MCWLVCVYTIWSEDDDEDDGEEGPQMESVMIQHTGAVNRLRVRQLQLSCSIKCRSFPIIVLFSVSEGYYK